MAQLKIVGQCLDMDIEAPSRNKKRKDAEEVAQSKTQTRYELGESEWVRISTRGKWTNVERVAAPMGGQTLAGALDLLLKSGVPFRMASPGVELTGKAQGKISDQFGVTLYGSRVVRVHGKTGSELALAIAFGLEDAKLPALTRKEAAAGDADPDNQEGSDPTDPDASEV